MGLRELLLGDALEELNKIWIVSRGKETWRLLKDDHGPCKSSCQTIGGFEVPGDSPTWQQG